MSTTIPITLADMAADVTARVRCGTDSTAQDAIYRYLNAGLHDFFVAYDWPWMERRSVITTHAPYTDGTVTISSAARTTVTGSSTLWNTAVTGYGFNNARAGGKMTFAGTEDVYTVSSVGSDTSITLVDNYVTLAGLAASSTYKYFEDEYALASDFMRLIDTRQFTDVISLPVIPRREFYRRFPRNNHTSRPTACSILDVTPTYSSTVVFQPRVVFHPAPDAYMVIPYRYISSNLVMKNDGTFLVNLTNTTDEPVIPLRYRMALVHYAVYSWYRDRGSDERAQTAYSEYSTIVKRGQADFRPETDHLRLLPKRMARMRIRDRGSRYATGTWFDEMGR